MADDVKASSEPSGRFHGFLSMQGRGTIALPAALRSRYHLDEPGAQVEITERDDGVLELRPTLAVPAVEAWFWDERWQGGEREVDQHAGAGRTTTHDTVDDFLAHLTKTGEE
jgi:bifunctional DNA-binding transcriptional regulator/antitoxin component of YhaV-PrlF toxin-antitoxin module